MRKWFIMSIVLWACGVMCLVLSLFMNDGITNTIFLIVGYTCIIIQIICTVMVVITKNKEIDSCVQQ
jgi:hypothetical protein